VILPLTLFLVVTHSQRQSDDQTSSVERRAVGLSPGMHVVLQTEFDLRCKLRLAAATCLCRRQVT
jgi:hypothetical protein